MDSSYKINNILDSLNKMSISSNEVYNKEILCILECTQSSLLDVQNKLLIKGLDPTPEQNINSYKLKRKRKLNTKAMYYIDRLPEVKKDFPLINKKVAYHIMSIEWEGMTQPKKDTYYKKSKYIHFSHEIMIANVNKYRAFIGKLPVPSYID
jgi:hypothetical protein